MMEIIALQEWYVRQNEAAGEHRQSILIATLDNPGWSLKVGLKNTELENRELVDITINRSENNWIAAHRLNNSFEAFGGPDNLEEIVRVFLHWELGVVKPEAKATGIEPGVSNLAWLSSFFRSLCDGDWEHGFGCRIQTSGNPGWRFDFDLSDTPFEETSFVTHMEMRSATDWLKCSKQGHEFTAVGGLNNLDELIGQFRQWIASNAHWESESGNSPSNPGTSIPGT